MTKLHQFCEVVKDYIPGGLHTLESGLHPSSLSESKYDCFSVSVMLMLICWYFLVKMLFSSSKNAWCLIQV